MNEISQDADTLNYVAEEEERRMPTTGLDYVPKTQRPAALISFTLSSVMVIFGAAFFMFPQSVLHFVFEIETTPAAPDDKTGEVISIASMSTRMVGGLILSQALSSVTLLLPILNEISSPSPVSVDKCRMSIGLQCIFGILVISCSLLDDRQVQSHGSHLSQATLAFLIYGFSSIILGCFAFMFSYWPVSSDALRGEMVPALDAQQRRQSESFNGREQSANIESNDIEPLLSNQTSSDSNQNEDDLELSAGYRLIEDDNDIEAFGEEGSHRSVAEDTVDAQEQHATSRIRGTRRLLSLAKSQVLYLYLGCAVLLVRLPFSLSIPHFVSTTLGCLSRGDFSGARHEVLLLFLMGTIDACLDFWCLFLFGYADLRILRGVRIDTFTSILKQDMAFFDEHSSGELASRLNSDCGQMSGDLTWFFRFSIESIVRITGITSYMLLRCPTLGACALSIVPMVAVINKFFSNWLSRNARKVQDALAEANCVAQETFSCIRTVIAFAAEHFELDKYVEKVDRQYQLNTKQIYMTGMYYMIVSTFLVNTFVQSMLLLVGAKLIEHGKLTTEVLLAFMLYQGQLQNEMMNLFQSYSSLIKSSGAGDRVFELLDRIPPEPGTGSRSVQLAERRTRNPTTDRSVSLELKNLHFEYPSRRDHSVLNGINLTVSAGQTIAIVGPSGSGKSTIVGLLQRFYDPSRGSILVDGVDLQAISLKEYRQRVGVVNQDNTLFAGSILSNIIYGIAHATKEQAIEAAKLANAHTFISSFPNGYETECGERGVQLSGGQKQRIAIARAIVREPSLLLLDEATSALDTESEEVVQRALDSLLKTNMGITTIIIAHRLRTVRNADLIAVVHDGRVVETGIHEELLQMDGGYYKEMVEKSHGDQLSLD